jgi:hypothetical protein
MMHALVAPAIMILSVSGYQAEAQEKSLNCEFNVVQQASPPLIGGPPELLSRVRVLRQPGSPVAIVMVDVTGTQITIDKDRSRSESNYVMDIQNVSDRPVSNVRVQVNIQVGHSEGGSGAGSPTQLLPGQTVRVTGRGGGSSQGPVINRNAEIVISAFVGAVEFDGCEYIPAQIRPARRP